MSIRSQEPILVHQLLHGYEDGHRLLSGSKKVDGISAKTILTLSDLSGQSGNIQPTGYLTGYPLSQIGAYAIARTWPAPEMSRPGCVWTQTLLVDFSDLVSLDDFSLLKLFRRPLDASDTFSYDNSLILDNKFKDNRIQQLPSRPILDLMEALYKYPNVSVFAQIKENFPVDEIAFALWLQQWPKLRRNFRFCTWVTSDRSRYGDQFDLQFVPSKSIFLGQKRNEDEKFWVDFVTTSNNNMDNILNVWAKELSPTSENNSLTNFLWRFGAEANYGRADFINLSLAWNVLVSASYVNIEAAIEVAERFTPQITSLTRQVLKELIHFSDINKKLKKSVLKYLVDYLHLLEGHVAEDDITKIAQIVWHNAPKFIWTFFQSNSLFFQDIASSAAKLMTPESALQGSKDDPWLFCYALEANLKLANSSSVWESPYPILTRIVEILNKHNKINDETLSFMLDSESKEVPSVAINFFGQKAVDAVLERFDCNKISDQHIINKWLFAAESHPQLLLTAVDQCKVKNMRTLALIASHVKYYSPPLSSARDEWCRAINKAEGELGNYLWQFHSFLLARAIIGVSPEPAVLINFSFEPLHRNLLAAIIDTNAWKMIESVLPEVSVWSSWDLAHRLRVGVMQTFINNELSPKSFIELQIDDMTFKKMVMIAGFSSKGISYLEKVLEWNRANPNEASCYRFDIIRKMVKKNIRNWFS
ncbi:GAP1-N1 domain-containing protein [Desulfogranum marinum]|uniref:GAP1-N1 domain-containing protein n=1 Tax=Desulfogranum marinum TaxID=453220 RepID=UPI00196480AC|nr:hypothetical protein [Desulfogranum marinum]MBM9514277.1 hypothetical protein [Desulfogranum marinum]